MSDSLLNCTGLVAGEAATSLPTGIDADALKVVQTTHLPAIETLRGIAATAVVAFHVSRHLNKAFGLPGLAALFEPGQAGVDVFFTLSGFIILHVHRKDIGHPARLRHYLGRRITRVLPLYWLALSITLAMGLAGSLALPGLRRLFFSVLLLPSHQEPLLGVAWTLQFEMLFYACFSLLILNRTLGSVILASWLFCIACSLGGLDLSILPPQVTAIYGIEFFFGMAMAQALHSRKVTRPGVVAGVGAMVFVVALAFGAPSIGEFATSARFMYGIPASLIVLGAAVSDQAGAITIPAWARRIGSASYSIYLFQFVFIGITWIALRRSGLDHRMPVPAVFVLLAVAATAGGVVTSWFVEKPLLRMLRT